MKIREATEKNINKYLKIYAPDRLKDYRKAPYNKLNDTYKTKLKRDDINYINSILKDYNDYNITKRKEERKQANKKYRIKKLENEYTNKLNELFNNKFKPGIEKLREPNQVFNIRIMDIDFKSKSKLLIEEFRDQEQKRILKRIIGRAKDIINFSNDTIITMKVNEDYFGLGGEGALKLIRAFENEIITDNLDSNNYIFQTIKGIWEGETIEFVSRLKGDTNRAKKGAFFKYYNKTNLELTRYQITDGHNNYRDLNINNDNCLIYALKILGVQEDKLSIIKNYVVSSGRDSISTNKLNEICNKINIRIDLTFYRKTQTENNKTDKITYGKEGKLYKLGLIEEHYFIFDDKTDYTSYFINNYMDIKHLENAKYIYYRKNNGYYGKDKNKCINSFRLIELLIENKSVFLEEITTDNINLFDEPNLKTDLKLRDYKNLNYGEEYSIKETNNKHLSKKELKMQYEIMGDYENDDDQYQDIREDPKPAINIFFDFETYIKPIENKSKTYNIHQPYLICFKNEFEKEIKSFEGDNCGLDFLNYLLKFKTPNNGIEYKSKSGNATYKIIAHNAKYDMRFLIKYLYNCKELTNGTNFITFSGNFGNKDNKIKIIIKDSLKLISSPLKDFSKMFFDNTEMIKEVMNYNYYSFETISKRFNPIEEILKGLKDDKEREQFKNNCINWGCFEDSNNNNVDIIKYSLKYCSLDVEILEKGYNIFRDWCIRDLNIDINNVLTLPAMGFNYLRSKGCYNGCMSLSGLPREFINNCCRGGRTMSANNLKYKVENKIINDFDAVSLYPSAMARIEGFVKGAPKVLNNNQLEYNIIKNYDFYIVEIEILKVGIIRKFPLMSKIKDDGTRNYTNNMIGELIIVNKYDLEDLIKFQNVEFKINSGYYFNEGFNNTITKEIEYLFSKRKELKKEENKCEVLYKLLMNSSYGKLIQKAHNKGVKFFNNTNDFNKYYDKHYNEMIRAFNYDDKNKDKFKVEFKTATGDFFAEPHLGSQILSMSKRIMNEIICLAEDLNLMIYYQDTDSIHIEDKSIKILEQEFKKLYNRELIGENMGEFHSDFNDKFKINGEIIKVSNVVSKKLIILGKKSYIDELEGTDKQGNKYINFHIRLKGIPPQSINYYVKQNNLSSEYELYEKLYNGENVIFDITAGGDKTCFEFLNNYSVNTKTEFKRNVKF
jgi:hypothetical protein